jgi:hypothetical protein
MNANGQTEMTRLEQLLHAAKVVYERNQNRALIAEYHAIAEEEGKVWAELTEHEIVDMIIKNESKKELARQVKCVETCPMVLDVNLDVDKPDDTHVSATHVSATHVSATHVSATHVSATHVSATHGTFHNVNLCVNCGVDMGDSNPRQFCEKWHCSNDKDEFRKSVQEQPHDSLLPSCADKHNSEFPHDDPKCEGCACPNSHNGGCLCFISQYCRDYYAAQKMFPCGGVLNCCSKTCGCDVSIESRRWDEWERKEELKTLEDVAELYNTMVEDVEELYNTMEGTSDQALGHIVRLTNRFQGMDKHFVYQLQMKIGSRLTTTFGYLPVPLEASKVKQVIGKDGYYFKLTTNNTGVDFIWHDRVENFFCFWGAKENVLQAMRIIQGRVNKYTRC